MTVDLVRLGRIGLLAAASALAAARRLGADRDQILARLQVRRPGRAVRGRDRQGLLQGRGPRRHDRHRGRLARADQPRRVRHLRHGLRRHQLADQVPRRQSGHADQGRVHGLQQAAVLDRRAQEPRRRRRRRISKARSSAPRRRTAPMRSGRSSPRRTASTPPRCTIVSVGFPVREPMLASRRGRRHHGLLVLLLHQPEGPRRSGERHHACC